MKTLKLRHIETLPFNQSEATMYATLCKAYPHLATLGPSDVILVRSVSGTQLLFIHGFATVNGPAGAFQYLRSERLRLASRRPWHPMMLANYAHDVGVHLAGIKTFEEHMARILATAAKALRRKTKETK